MNNPLGFPLNDPILAQLWQEVTQGSYKRQSEVAKADPLSNKLTRVFDAGVNLNYRYWPAPKNGKGQTIRFCWSTHRNAAGFFLGWREVIMKNGTTKRDRWLSRRVKAKCKAIAKRRAEQSTGDGERQ